LKNIQAIKQRFGIIGNSPLLNFAIETAIQVAPTDVSVFINGESGTGKEAMPQVIHHSSSRKHNPYIAVNCGAIPEGTIDSELFGHEKGSFTGAHESRKGYFEVADTGTIFLDEVAELPLSTQVRLLRVLETGEFIKVGSSKTIKTNVRIIAATNMNIPKAIKDGKFREDLFFRLNTVPILMPPLRERLEDIHLLFRKFSSDFAEKYRMPVLKLNEGAIDLLSTYRWPGNVRQLKNIAEQMSVLEKERLINRETLTKYLPGYTKSQLPVLVPHEDKIDESEKEMVYKILFDLKNEMSDLKNLVVGILQTNSDNINLNESNSALLHRIFDKPINEDFPSIPPTSNTIHIPSNPKNDLYAPNEGIEEHTELNESLKLADKEKELIIKALSKHHNKRKYAASDLGISERTLYRKIKEYNI
jgi:transcriptional regulator with PAS, ATPase and Fis domain